MKDRTGIAIQFSGYPLKVVEVNRPSKLKIIKSKNIYLPAQSKLNIADDPKYWDVDWFNNYE